jgi:hypothetical protein
METAAVIDAMANFFIITKPPGQADSGLITRCGFALVPSEVK